MRLARVLPSLALLALAACGSRELYIESDTQWAGTVQALGNVSGSGTRVIDLNRAPSPVCWTIGKTTSAGTLHVYGRQSSFGGTEVDIVDEGTTTAPNGVVQGCLR
jgi:hypothetical protein